MPQDQRRRNIAKKEATEKEAHCPMQLDTLWLFNIAMENGPFIDGLPINFMVIFNGYVK